MTEFLGDPQVGDVWEQLAQIITDPSIPKDKIKLAVNDVHGIINKSVIMPKNFLTQFYQMEKDGKPTATWRRRVKISEITGNTVFFIRLDAQDKVISEPQGITKKIFLETFYLPQHQMGNE